MIANILLVHPKWIPEVMKAKNYGHVCSRKTVIQFMLYAQKNEETWDAIQILFFSYCILKPASPSVKRGGSHFCGKIKNM